VAVGSTRLSTGDGTLDSRQDRIDRAGRELNVPASGALVESERDLVRGRPDAGRGVGPSRMGGPGRSAIRRRSTSPGGSTLTSPTTLGPSALPSASAARLAPDG